VIPTLVLQDVYAIHLRLLHALSAFGGTAPEAGPGVLLRPACPVAGGARTSLRGLGLTLIYVLRFLYALSAFGGTAPDAGPGVLLRPIHPVAGGARTSLRANQLSVKTRRRLV
jgi:hypothetical protein